tara:strand:+ start:6916 stop:7467 length:552 start_codon:yes stop_codon:yes gene_type:complete
MKDDGKDREILMSFVDGVIQNLRTLPRFSGNNLNNILKSIDGAEDISEINAAPVETTSEVKVFHMSQFELGYFYILNSRADWINILMPLDINKEYPTPICSYYRVTIYKTIHPSQMVLDSNGNRVNVRFWYANPNAITTSTDESITQDSYWHPLELCLKIPISMSNLNRFINWSIKNPWEVKE